MCDVCILCHVCTQYLCHVCAECLCHVYTHYLCPVCIECCRSSRLLDSKQQQDFAALATRASQMVEILSEENKGLRNELENYYKKASRLHKVWYDTLSYIPPLCLTYHYSVLHTTTLSYIPLLCLTYHHSVLHTTTLSYIPACLPV